MRKPKLQKSRDGKLRSTWMIEIRLTTEEETILDLMYEEYKDSLNLDAARSGSEPIKCTFRDFLVILLRRQIDQERESLKDAMAIDGETRVGGVGEDTIRAARGEPCYEEDVS